jgi:hypothetical protein
LSPPKAGAAGASSSVEREDTAAARNYTITWVPVLSSDGSAPIIDAATDADGNVSLTAAFTLSNTSTPKVTQLNNVVFAVVNDPALVQFSAQSHTVAENAGAAAINVTRMGDTSVTSTINYRTIDDPAAVRCDARGAVAYARCDYATTVDTLTFAPGETTKTITVPLIDDAHVEDPETFSVVLGNPAGGLVGATHTVVVTLQDNDAAGQPNPILSTPFFVRMHYLDFLSREPDANGFNAWANVLNNCPDVNNNPDCDRITVSSSFFRSPEFQLKGLYVYLFYKAALNRRPTYEEVISDMRSVTGQTPEEVYWKRAAFANSFGARQELNNLYGAPGNQSFVDALLSRYSLQQITTEDPADPDGVTQVTLTRQQLADGLASGSLTRAKVLRALIQSNEVEAAEYNGAFVAMQYYGYLRRAPEEDGYQAWLRYLNANPTDFRTMVNGFLNSPEYRLRFGRP